MSKRTIPIYRRNGDIAGYACVDATDHDRLVAFKWHMDARGYVRRYENSKVVRLHREVLGEAPFHGAEPDHINRDPLDNTRANLRWVSHAQNVQNKGVYRNSKSGVRGVWWDASINRWRAQVQHGGRKVWRAYFTDKNEAAVAVEAARSRVFTHSVAALTGVSHQ
jgi:hypothetical protein